MVKIPFCSSVVVGSELDPVVIGKWLIGGPEAWEHSATNTIG